jgi:predicted ABC-type transport system involved in lysophospholipase L1 biosynthesis ATPase subunit
MSAVENVELPMILAGKLNSSQRKERARRCLSYSPNFELSVVFDYRNTKLKQFLTVVYISLLRRVGMGPRLGHIPSMLSGGEQVV